MSRFFPVGTRIGEFTIGEPLPIAPTGNSFVFNATSSNTSGKFVFKYIHPTVPEHLRAGEMYANETFFGCEYLAVGFGFQEITGSVGYFMKYYNRGDLFDYVLDKTLTEESVRTMSYRILQGIHYIHHRDFVHRDVKLENVFLDGNDEVPLTYLGDFGHATPWRGELLTDRLGTTYYWAPELLSGNGYDQSVDMWAFGVLFYRLLTGKFPFPDSKREFAAFKWSVLRGAYDKDHLFDAQVTDCARDLVSGLLKPNPEERLTADKALDHLFYEPLFADTIGGLKVELNLFDDAFVASDTPQVTGK
jgi:serine/threonine protein kinase